jgi:LmbE family N-acetylglucosaminyl deacetylase
MRSGSGRGAKARRVSSADYPLLAVSPHLDDAVLSCGDWLAAHPCSLVVTVFAGRPPRGAPLAPWDADAGFSAADDVIGLRRGEDRRALSGLGARPSWLRFRDAQYGGSPSAEAVTRALGAAIRRVNPPAVCFPLGLFHSDHLLVAEACLRLACRDERRAWLAYADALYRSLDGLLARRLAELRRRGFRLSAAAPRRDAGEAKRRAIAEYASQLRALRTPGRLGIADALAPERIWRLRR